MSDNKKDTGKMFYFIKKSTGSAWEGGRWENAAFKTELGAKRAASALFNSDTDIERVFVGSAAEKEPTYIAHNFYKTRESETKPKWLING